MGSEMLNGFRLNTKEWMIIKKLSKMVRTTNQGHITKSNMQRQNGWTDKEGKDSEYCCLFC